MRFEGVPRIVNGLVEKGFDIIDLDCGGWLVMKYDIPISLLWTQRRVRYCICNAIILNWTRIGDRPSVVVGRRKDTLRILQNGGRSEA